MPNRRMADAEKTSLHRRPCGIIRVTALCDLCRYRHRGHATGHPKRLGRDLKNAFGSKDYAREELVAVIWTVCTVPDAPLNGMLWRDAGGHQAG
ncbi:DNA primase traC [Sphingobium fuliginis]|uniref:DNA primase traC n=1 Tax=Sphingobium fuliginis (strain ATCC 27551) TaxID=336203 RepID=A0A292ZIT7_SPHSA|nr:DNA primase traC [Sphingobium fuliginis]